MPKTPAATRHNVLVLAAFLALSPRLAPAATPTTYIGPDQGLWSNPATDHWPLTSPLIAHHFFLRKRD